MHKKRERPNPKRLACWDLLLPGSTEHFQRLTPGQKVMALKLVRQHLLAGWVYSLHQETLSEVQEFKKDWIKNFYRNTLILQFWQDILDETNRQGVGITPLKGLCLLHSVYENPGQRFLSDMDLLVSASELDLVKDLLIKKGFEEISITKWKANQFKYLFRGTLADQDLVVELHGRLLWNEPVGWTWPVQKNTDSTEIRLQLEAELVYLCGHLAYQHNFIHLHWLLDIHLFLKKYGDQISGDLVMKLASQLGLIQSVQLCLLAVRQFFHTENSLELWFPSGTWKSQLLTENFLWEPSKNKFHYFLIKHLVKDKVKENAIYDWNWVRQWIKGQIES